MTDSFSWMVSSSQVAYFLASLRFAIDTVWNAGSVWSIVCTACIETGWHGIVLFERCVVARVFGRCVDRTFLLVAKESIIKESTVLCDFYCFLAACFLVASPANGCRVRCIPCFIFSNNKNSKTSWNSNEFWLFIVTELRCFFSRNQLATIVVRIVFDAS